MTGPAPSTTRLLVILDPDYGDRLREVPQGQPVWIVMSSVNEPVIRSLWELRPDANQLTGITSFRFDARVPAAERFLNELYTIDLHHGAYSSGNPYTELEVIGAPLTAPIRVALSQIGFAEFSEGRHGFIARRGDEEARRLRN